MTEPTTETTEELRNPPFSMAVIGAPGAGKTRLIQAFKEASKEWFDERGLGELRTIDHIDRILEEKQNRAVGVYGDHYVALAMYFARQQFVDNATLNGECFITSGSLLDNLAHLQARLKLLQQMVQTPETEQLVAREVIAAQWLSTCIMDGRWRVNFVFLLPLPPQIVVPGQEKGTFPVEVDAILRDLNVKMRLGIPVLTGSTEEMVQQMIDSLNEHYHPEVDPSAVERVELRVPVDEEEPVIEHQIEDE